MLQVNQLTGFGVGGRVPLEALTYVTSAQSNAAQTNTTATFSGVSLGDAYAGRRIFVCYQGEETGGSHNLTAVTVAGVSATRYATSPANGSSRAEIWGATVPEGTTGDIVLTNSGATDWVKTIFVYSLDSVTKIYNLYSANDTASPFTYMRTFNAGEFYIGVGRCLSSETETYTNATENATQTISGRTRASSASYGPAASGSRTITFAPSSSTSAYLTSVVIG